MAKSKKNSFSSEQLNELRKLEREANALDGGDGFSTDEPENDIGRRIEFQRRASALTQGQLSDLTKKADKANKGLSRSSISLYELGINRPGIKEIRLLCEVLKVSPSYLIYGDEHPFEQSVNTSHFDGIAESKAEYLARVLYCFWRLDPFYARPIMAMMMRTLGNDIKGLMNSHADRVFLDLADDLRAVLEKKQS